MRKLTFLIFFIKLSTYAQYEAYLKLSPDELDNTFIDKWHMTFNSEDVDTAAYMPEIRSMRQFAIENDADFLEFMMDISELKLYFGSSEISKDYLLNRLLFFRDKTIDRENKNFEAYLEFMLGDFYLKRAKNYELAFGHFERVLTLNQSLNSIEHPTKFREMIDLTYIYFNFDEIAKTIEICKSAIKELKEEQILNSKYYPYNYNMLGESFKQLNQKDSAFYYLEKALEASTSTLDTFSMGSSEGYLGKLHYKHQEFEKAITHLETGLGFLKSINEDIREQNSQRATLIDAYLRTGQLEKAKTIMLELEEQNPFTTWQGYRPETYRLISRYYIRTGDIKKGLAYLDSSHYWRNQNKVDFDTKKLLRIQQKKELDKFTADREAKILKRNVIIGGLILLLSLALFIYYTNVMNARKKLFLAKKELSQAHIYLDNFKAEILEKTRLLEQINSQNQDEEILQKLQKITILTKQEWKQFRELFDKVHVGFISRLKAKFPMLTPSEVRYLTLTKLGFSNEEIAFTLGISPASVRSTPYRFRKKANLPEDTNISELVNYI